MDSPLQLMHQSVPALSSVFAGPLHLNAKGSGLIACAVHEMLHFTCGSNQCAVEHAGDQPRDAASGAGSNNASPLAATRGVTAGAEPVEMDGPFNASLAMARHRAYCEPLRTGVGGGAVLPQAHSHQAHSHSRSSPVAPIREEYGTAFWDRVQGVLHLRYG